MVLETPIERDGKEDKGIWAKEIKLLESLIGMDPKCDEFITMEKTLADEGKEERSKYQEAYDRKIQKEQLAAEKQRNGVVRKRKKNSEKEATKSESGSD